MRVKLKGISVLWNIFIFSDNLVSIFSYVSWQLKMRARCSRKPERSLSWVLKLWDIKEAHIPPTISKNQNVSAFSEKMTAQKASQSLMSTSPYFLHNSIFWPLGSKRSKFCDIFTPHPPILDTTSLHSQHLIMPLFTPPLKQSSSLKTYLYHDWKYVLSCW